MGGWLVGDGGGKVGQEDFQEVEERFVVGGSIKVGYMVDKEAEADCPLGLSVCLTVCIALRELCVCFVLRLSEHVVRGWLTTTT